MIWSSLGLPKVEISPNCACALELCLDVLLIPVTGKGLNILLTSSMAVTPNNLVKDHPCNCFV